MNTLPLHPAVVHVPLGLALIMPVVLLGLLWAIVTDRLPGKVWLLALLLQGILLSGAGVALWTGGQDEGRLEARAGEASLEAHERAGQAFAVAVAATFAVGAVGFLLRGRRGPFVAAGGTAVALSVAALLLGIQVGHRGGLLVHAGVDQRGSLQPEAAPDQTSEQTSEQEDDDD